MQVQLVVGAADATGRRSIARPLAAGRRRGLDPARHRHARHRGTTDGGADGCGRPGRWPPARRRAGRPRRTSTRPSPRAASPTARRSAACGRCGGAGDGGVRRGRPAGAGRAQAGGFGVHPALLDAALHAAPGREHRRGRRRCCRSPGTACACTAAGAAVLRVRLAPVGPDALSLSGGRRERRGGRLGRLAAGPAGLGRAAARAAATGRRRRCSASSWSLAPAAEPVEPVGRRWAVLGDGSGHPSPDGSRPRPVPGPRGAGRGRHRRSAGAGRGS